MTMSASTFDILQGRLRFRGQLVARTGLRIGAGRDTDVAGHDLPVMRDAAGRPFIPGSSFKGVLRSSLEALLRGLSDNADHQRRRLACMVLTQSERCITDTQIRAWREADTNRADLARNVIDGSCLICQTFGSTWLQSHVAVRDLAVSPALWFGQFEVRQGVSLDRDTETAREGQLYSFETVPVGTRFDLEIEADNLVDWQKGLLWLGLQPFIRAEMSIGGARSRGLGMVELIEGDWSVWDATPGNPECVIAFLSDGLAALDLSATSGWQRALREKLEEVLRA